MTMATHSQQLDLLDLRTSPFMGWSFRPELDRDRLTTNLRRVLYELLDGRWHDLRELRLIGGSAADSRIRDLYRKRESGGYELPIGRRRKVGQEKQGCWEYRLEVERLEERDSFEAVHKEIVLEIFRLGKEQAA